MRFHVLAAAAAIGAGWFAQLDRSEWLWVLVTITLVWCAELINTAVEATVDLASSDIHPFAKAAKDAAAGAVLIAALFAVAVAFIVLLPAVLRAL